MKSSLPLVTAALFAALITAGAAFSIPLPPPFPPFSPSVFFILLAGLLLGAPTAAGAVGLYLLLGALGLPVFANGAGGIGYFLGPTGGFLIGWLAAALVTGMLADRSHWKLARSCVAAAAGIAAMYAIGIPWMWKVLASRTLGTVALMMAPYFLGDLAKGAAAALLVRALKPALGRYFGREAR